MYITQKHSRLHMVYPATWRTVWSTRKRKAVGAKENERTEEGTRQALGLPERILADNGRDCAVPTEALRDVSGKRISRGC